jgi:hypothetical protein
VTFRAASRSFDTGEGVDETVLLREEEVMTDTNMGGEVCLNLRISCILPTFWAVSVLV